jgi:GAF domain-containing protein/HAMP domain-containing protein
MKGISISLAQRATLIFVLITLLIGSAIGVGIWFSTSVDAYARALQNATDQAVLVSDLQLSWLSVVGLLDSLSITRPAAETNVKLSVQMNDLNTRLLGLTQQPLGLTPEMIAENQQLALELQRIGDDMSALVYQLYALVEQNRWGTALQLRQSEMAGLQSRLDANLSRLNANIESDVAAQIAEVQRLENIARIAWITTLVLSVVLIGAIGWISRQRIIRPLNQLTMDVQRITKGDLLPITPLPQQDEIGELSRSFAMMTEWQRQSYETLEKRVAERTQELELRNAQIQVAAQVGRDIIATREMDVLLNQAVNLIRDRFGFYQAGIFLVDERHEYAVLRAATGRAGEEMLQQGHKLKIGETGLVGYTTQKGEARIALDVGQDAVHFKNPLLPDTRSEVALPLTVSDQVIGALDVQSREAGAFDDESITILQVVADQLAIAIQNARLLQEVQSNLQELEAAYGRYDLQAWERFVQTRDIIGYRYDGLVTAPISRQDAELQLPPSESRPLSIPLQVRGHVIGSLDAWPEQEELSDDEIYLLTMVGTRISQILESARLFEETQTRAAHEEAINRLTANIARSLDADGVLQIAARELGGLPAVLQAAVYLEAQSLMQAPGNGDGHEPDSKDSHMGGEQS